MSTTPCQPATTGTFSVDKFVVFGIVMGTMVSTRASYQRTKLAFKLTRRSGKTRKRGSLVLVTVGQALAVNMRGPSLVTRRVITNNLWKAVFRSCGTCSATSGMDGIVPIQLPSMLLLLQLHLHFLLHCLHLIHIIRMLSNSRTNIFLNHSLAFLLSTNHLLVPAHVTRNNLCLSMTITNILWLIQQWLPSCLTSRRC